MYFRIGEKVRIKDDGAQYKTYKGWADLHNLSGWQNAKSVPKDGREFKIIRTGVHSGYSDVKLYAIEDADGCQYIFEPRGLEPIKEHPSAGILEPFDRVMTPYGNFIVADGKGGRFLIGENGKWMDINEFNAVPVEAVFKAPAYVSDYFNFGEIGEVKWENAELNKRRELSEKICELEQQAEKLYEELYALEKEDV
jgi:hypothetical protein